MASPWCIYYQPKLELENPPENEHPYVVEMFGELYFTENPPRPVTMSELFGDYPKPAAPLPPNETNETNDKMDGDGDGAGEEKVVANEDEPVSVEEQRRDPTPRRRRIIIPVNREKKVWPPVIHSLRPFYQGNPMFEQSCDKNVCSWCAEVFEEEEDVAYEGGSSSSGMEDEGLSDE